MATLSKGYTFGATESVTNTKLHNLVDLGTITGIVNADIAAGAAIDSTKLDLSGAGYLTSGGDFDVTGQYSFSDLTRVNIQSLASIANVHMNLARVSSLASLADVHIQTGIFASLASIAEVRATAAYISSLASLPSLQIVNQVNEFSTDGTLAGDSDTALPTEKAVKTYVDANGGDISALSGTGENGVNIGANISLGSSGFYLVVFEIDNLSSDAPIYVRFDSTASGYGWAYSDVTFATTPAESYAGDNSDTEIQISPTLSGTDHLQGFFHITVASGVTSISGQAYAVGSGSRKVNFSGAYSSEASDFEFLLPLSGTPTFDYNYKLYELSS